jgi:hypothetical protein
MQIVPNLLISCGIGVMPQFRMWFIGGMETAGQKQEGVIWCVQLVPAYGSR